MDFAQVLIEELELIGLRRRRVRQMAPQPPPPGDGSADAGPAGAGSAGQPVPVVVPGADQDRPGATGATDPEKQARLAAMDRHLAGLALSGGGIRSATFALGVLQGLADLKLLSRFDYLSTVSGGGYIGGWLAAWIKREGNPLSVEQQLSPSRISEAEVDRQLIGRGRIVDEEPEPVHHLRSYSNYLTPRPGLLTVDTWTLLTIYIRNALINLLLLFPVALIFVLLGRCILWFYRIPGRSPALRATVLWSLCGLLFLAFLSMGLHLSYLLLVRARGPRDAERSSRWGGMAVTLTLTILWPLVVAAVLACWTFSIEPRSGISLAQLRPLDEASFQIRLPGPWPVVEYFFPVKEKVFDSWYYRGSFLWISAVEYGVVFGGLVLLVHLIGYGVRVALGLDPDTIARAQGEHRNRLVGLVGMSLAAWIAGFNGGFLFFTLASQVLWRLHDQPHAIVTIGPPLALLVVVAATFVEVWLLGRWQGDDLREWWARVCAWLVIIAAGWLAFFGITVYGPMLIQTYLHSFVKSVLALGWLTTAAGGAYAARLPAAAAKGRGVLVKVLLRVAPSIFLAGLLLFVATVVDLLVVAERSRPDAWRAGPLQSSPNARLVYWQSVIDTPIENVLLVIDVCAILATVAAVMSNVNLFSLNSMYAQRLTRCYLGASRPKREWARRGAGWRPGRGGAPTAALGPARWANSVTGFDPDDDIPLWRMRIGAEPPPGDDFRGPATEYLGPHLIMNTALNLVAGAELAWQNRKAESFILTPTHCGSKGTGYAATIPPTGHELTLGRAMSISGAAVDSNIGLHQSSALIALLTTFNARLGWWIKNPNRPEWDASSPSLALPLLLELLGRTDERRKFVHLSDGGHFENLGVYELIRRRCRYIVCCDAGTDPQASDDNLAAMIRLCRTDFGVRIEIDTSFFARQGPEKLSRCHCAVGTIRYDDVDGGELPGIFLYLRTSLTGDEPPDVQEYAAKNPDFPWQSTLDQFFDEPQFESYRALGFHVAQAALKDALWHVNSAEPLWSNRSAELEFKRGNQRLFSAIQRRWAPAPSNQGGNFMQAVQSWSDLQKAFRTDKDLAPLSIDIYPELSREISGGLTAPQLYAVAQMIQVMEDAWLDLGQKGFRALPRNRGWMSVFRRWASAPALRRLWPVLRGEYGQDFVNFCETQLELGARVDVLLRSLIDPADPTFFDAARKLFASEFAREWPGQKSLDELIADAESNWSGWTDKHPISLVLQAPPGAGAIAASPDKVACGIVFASRVSAGDPGRGVPPRFEIFIWMRRAYRAMGIASRCAKTILTEFREMPRDEYKHRPYTLQARYPAPSPAREEAKKEEMEYLVWQRFFSHYDLRCPRGQEPVRDGYWVIERTFQPDEIEP